MATLKVYYVNDNNFSFDFEGDFNLEIFGDEIAKGAEGITFTTEKGQYYFSTADLRSIQLIKGDSE